jgi:hypothetical protein
MSKLIKGGLCEIMRRAERRLPPCEEERTALLDRIEALETRIRESDSILREAEPFMEAFPVFIPIAKRIENHFSQESYELLQKD